MRTSGTWVTLHAALLAVLHGQPVSPGQNYRIKLLTSILTEQPSGWYLAAHRNWAADRPDNDTTYAIVRREPDINWAGEWQFESAGDQRMRIKLAKGQHGQPEGWYLDALRTTDARRDGFSTYVVVSRHAHAADTTSHTASEWLFEFGEKGWKIKLEIPVQNRHPPGWYLDARRVLSRDKRSNDSSYVQVQDGNPVDVYEWAFEAVQGCKPLCRFDAASNSCHVSRTHTAEVYKSVPGSAWSTIAEKTKVCEAAGREGAAACRGASDCELDGYGRCSPSRTWAVSNLADLPSNAESRLGPSRCAAFGNYLRVSSTCSKHTDPTTCEGGLGNSTDCRWDVRRGACDISSNTFLALLRQGFRDELARVTLRREICNSRGEAECTGPQCRWIPPEELAQGRLLTAHVAPPKPVGKCVLPSSDALLAISGEDCPLSSLIRRQLSCREAESETACSSGCQWLGTRCEALPLSLEMDVLPMLGMSSVRGKVAAAERLCAQHESAEHCHAQCTPEPSSATAALGQLSLPRKLLLAAVFIWTATAAHLS
mmetsp:Transcript_81212/g.134161  ORF Transcript_81212/g.134161 Transcript_81212/m.134161 type:complete len:541 (-) Transcript_81212:54-1676(-)